MRAATTGTALVLLLWSAAAQAVELQGSARAWVGSGLDTNPRRDFVAPGGQTPTDVALHALAQLEGALLWQRALLAATYEAGGRKFVLVPSEDTVVQNAAIDAEAWLTRGLGVGARLRGRDRRGAERSYTDLGADALVLLAPDRPLEASGRVGAHRFLFWERFAYSFFGPSFGFQARYRFTRRHAVSTHLDYEPRTYNAEAAPNPGLDGAPAPGTRRDGWLTVGLAYSYRGGWAFTGGYDFLEQSSNSFGESVRWHRLSLSVGVPLFWKLTLLGNAALQLAQYPDGIYLATDLLVLDDENQSQVSLKLLRPLGDFFELDLRWALYFNALPRNELTYLRTTVTLGLAFRLGT